jgi:hypothetical protein
MSQEAYIVFILFSIYQVKHFLADFLFQHNYMLKKIRPDWDFIWPLALHCSVHGVMTLAIVVVFRFEMWWLAIVDFVVHFLMDRFRSGPKYLGRFNDINKSIFWWILGMDQMIHHLTHILIIWLLLYY